MSASFKMSRTNSGMRRRAGMNFLVQNLFGDVKIWRVQTLARVTVTYFVDEFV